jgi:hypothetical protein
MTLKATVLHGPGDVRYKQVAEGYKAMDQRRAIKTMLTV